MIFSPENAKQFNACQGVHSTIPAFDCYQAKSLGVKSAPAARSISHSKES
jgi:hypothetical protein